MSASTRFVRKVFEDFRNRGGHDATCMPQLEILSARPGCVKASLRIDQKNLNRIGTLHGGLIGTLVDTLGSLALSSKGMWLTGVSTDIHTTYGTSLGLPQTALRSNRFIRAAGGPGDSVLAEAVIDSMGKTLAFTSTRITHPETGKLLAHGTHTKYIVDALKDPQKKNITFDEAGENVLSGTEPK